MQDLKTTVSGASAAVLVLLAHFHVVVPADLQMPIIALAIAVLGYFSKDSGDSGMKRDPANGQTLANNLSSKSPGSASSRAVTRLLLLAMLALTVLTTGCGKFSVHKLAVGCDVAMKVATTAVDLEAHFAEDGIIQPGVHAEVKPRFEELKRGIADVAKDIDELDKSGQSLTANKRREVYTAIKKAIQIARDLNRDEVLQIKNPEHKLIITAALEAFSTGLDLVSAEF